jgi:hypothetical protein
MAISSLNYPSLATGYLIIKCLRRIITAYQVEESEELKLLKLCLLNQFNHYFDDVMEDEEKETGLVRCSPAASQIEGHIEIDGQFEWT